MSLAALQLAARFAEGSPLCERDDARAVCRQLARAVRVVPLPNVGDEAVAYLHRIVHGLRDAALGAPAAAALAEPPPLGAWPGGGDASGLCGIEAFTHEASSEVAHKDLVSKQLE